MRVTHSNLLGARDTLVGKPPFSVLETESNPAVNSNGEFDQPIQASRQFKGIDLVLNVLSQAVEVEPSK